MTRSSNKRSQSKVLATTPILALGLQACGGGSSTGAVVDNQSQALSGNVVKGPLTGAVVFLDENGDGVLNEGEQSVSTGPGGAYTLNIEGEIPDGAEIIVLTSGAKDESTGKTLDADVVLRAPATSKVITPLTTLASVAGLSSAEVAQALGISEDIDIFEFNPFDEANASDESKRDAAVKLETMAVAVTQAIVETAKAASDNQSVNSTSLDDSLRSVADAFKSKVDSGANIDYTAVLGQDFLDEVKTSFADRTDQDIELADTVFGDVVDQLRQVVAAGDITSDTALEALSSISDGATVLNVVMLEAGALNALPPTLAFEQMFDEWANQGFDASADQMQLLEQSAGSYVIAVVVDGETLNGEILVTGKNLGQDSATVSRIEFVPPYADAPVMYMDLPAGTTPDEVISVLEAYYRAEYNEGEDFSIFPPSGDDENDQIVTLLPEAASDLGVIMDTTLFGGADKIVFGSQYDDVFALQDYAVEFNFDGTAITPTVGTTVIYTLEGADRIMPLLSWSEAVIGDVTIKDFTIGEDFIDFSDAGLTADHLIASAYETDDGVTGTRLQFDFDLDDSISSEARSFVAAENSRGTIDLEGVSLTAWNAQIESDSSVVVKDGKADVLINFDVVVGFPSLLSDAEITPDYEPGPTEGFFVNFFDSSTSGARDATASELSTIRASVADDATSIDGEGRVFVADIYERTVEAPAGDESSIIGKWVFFGQGINVDENGEFVSGLINKAQVFINAGVEVRDGDLADGQTKELSEDTLALQWEGFSLADDFNDLKVSMEVGGSALIAAYIAGANDDGLDDVARGAGGIAWDDASQVADFEAALRAQGFEWNEADEFSFRGRALDDFNRYTPSDENWTALRQFLEWVDVSSDMTEFDNYRVREYYDASDLQEAVTRYENGFDLSGADLGSGDEWFGSNLRGSQFNDMLWMETGGYDEINLSDGGSDVIMAWSFYTPSYLTGFTDSDGQEWNSAVNPNDVADLVPENYVDRDTITSFDFGENPEAIDFIAVRELPDTESDFLNDDGSLNPTEWWGMRQSLDTDNDGNHTRQEGYSEIGIQDITVSYDDLDQDGTADDVLLVLENVYHWYRPFGEANGTASQVADRYEIEFVDPVGLEGITSDNLASAVSEHLIVDFTNNAIDSAGEYRADPVTLADVSAYKAFLTDDLGMGISESWNFIDAPLTAENGFIDVDPAVDGYLSYEAYVSEIV